MRPYIIRNVLVCEEDMILNNEKIAKALDVDPYLLFIANPKANKLEPRVDIHRKK